LQFSSHISQRHLNFCSLARLANKLVSKGKRLKAGLLIEVSFIYHLSFQSRAAKMLLPQLAGSSGADH